MAVCYVAEEGMYCLICRKHQLRHPQNQKIPCVRLKLNAVSTHSTSSSFISDRELMLQNVSCFHQEIVKKSEVQDIVLEQAFSTAYFLTKSFIANRQFFPLLFIERIYNVESLRYFEHRSARSFLNSLVKQPRPI